MKTIVIFQGGGALGAFGAGAWEALAQSSFFGPDGEHELLAVAGASIGAINAATVAHHHRAPDLGVQALKALWHDRIATPSFPFFGIGAMPVPPSAGDSQAWNGFITGTLLGNRGLFRARWTGWQPLSGMDRMSRPLHDRRAMWQLLESEFPRYASAPGGGPMLACAAVDILAGELSLFDSDAAPLLPAHLAASSAIPLLFDPVEIDGRPHWDGEVTRDTMLPKLLIRLRDGGRLARDEPLQLITLEQFPRASAAVPRSGAEITYRVLNMVQAGKLDTVSVDGVNIARHLRLIRDPLPEDGVSGQFDYSPRRLARLWEQGRAAAQRGLGGQVNGVEAQQPFEPVTVHAPPA